MKKNLLLFSVGLILLLNATACTGNAPAEPSATVTFTFEPPAATVTSTNTPEPTFTPFPTATATVTLTPTSAIGWSNFKVTFSDLISTYGVFFKIPGLDKVYDVTIDGLRYSCYIDAGYPEELFCYGEKFRDEIQVPVVFSDQSSGTPIFTGSLIVSPAMFVDPLPECIPSTWCPDRGKSMHCETEDRTWYEPRCIVSTCSDVCGFCLGINTCDLMGSVPIP